MRRCFHILIFVFSIGILHGQNTQITSDKNSKRQAELLQLLSSAATNDNPDFAANLKIELSEIYLAQGNVSQALKQLLEAKLNLSENASNEVKVDILFRLGKIYFDEKIYEDALTYFEESSRLNNGKNEEIERLKGESYKALKQTDKAFASFNNLYRKCVANNDHNGQLRYLQQIVDLYYESKDFKKALAFNQRLEKLVENTPLLKEQYVIVNNLGYNYTFLKEHQKAIEQFKKSLLLIPNNQKSEKVSILNNIAICYNNMGNMDAAIQYFSKAIELTDVKKDAYTIAQINHLMATTYYKDKNYKTALYYLNKAIKIATDRGYNSLLAESFYTAATIRVEQNEFKDALNYFEDYLSIRDSLSFEKALSRERLVQEKIILQRLEKELELFKIDKALKKAVIDKLNLENNNLKLAKETLELNALKNRQQLEISEQQSTIQQEKLKNQDLEITKERQRLLIANKDKNEARQEVELLRLNSDKEKQAIELLKKDKLLTQEQQTAELLLQQSKIDKLQITSQNQYKKTSTIIGILATGLLLLLLAGVFYMSSSNKKLNSQNAEINFQRKKIESEKEVADNLLHNILPVPVADELKSTGAASPKRFEKVTVLFTDFNGFTNISSKLSPERIIQDLEECFSVFDQIIEKYNVEKIKTIGDSYMCAGGIPVGNDSNPLDCVLAAIEMQEYIEDLYEKKRKEGREYWRMRVGIHTGPVVAGVIGSKKFSYDIWGDTVNIASRLETNGEVGKVNISQDTYNHVKEKVNCNYRGEIEAKNRGSLKMYFVDELI